MYVTYMYTLEDFKNIEFLYGTLYMSFDILHIIHMVWYGIIWSIIYTSTVNCRIRKLDLHHVTSKFIIELPPLHGIRARIPR